MPRLALAMRRKWCLAPGVSIPTERADRHCRNLNFYNSRMYRFKIIHNLKNVATEGERVSEEAKWSVNRRLNLRDCPFAYLLAMAKKDAQVESQKAEIAILRGRSRRQVAYCVVATSPRDRVQAARYAPCAQRCRSRGRPRSISTGLVQGRQRSARVRFGQSPAQPPTVVQLESGTGRGRLAAGLRPSSRQSVLPRPGGGVRCCRRGANREAR